MAFNESEFYDKILKFSESNSNGNKTKLVKNQSIKELMKAMNGKNDKLFTENALLLIMALFDEDLNDDFYSKTKNIQKATKKNKEIIRSILEEEFLS